MYGFEKNFLFFLTNLNSDFHILASSLPKGISGLRLNKSSSALHNLDTNSNATTLKPKKIRDPNDFGSNFIDIMKAPLYQCFDVNLITKFTNSPIEMGISETKLEITPKMNNPSSHFTGKFLSRILGVKARNINIEDVVDCELHKQGMYQMFFHLINNDLNFLKKNLQLH